jgi:hypothetical protein
VNAVAIRWFAVPIKSWRLWQYSVREGVPSMSTTRKFARFQPAAVVDACGGPAEIAFAVG